MTDAKYFTTTKKGEMFELKSELNSERKDKKKDALKKVIASMTVGKDVSQLFPDVVNCMQTDDLELKKLVYLYLMNYAKSQPDLTIMAVNTFVNDSDDPNPLIRALAIRTMACIRVETITDYFCVPLRKCLKDDDPYVRKTAAVSVAKLYQINGPLVEEQGFLDLLWDLLSDSNPMVVANAVASIAEIKETNPAVSERLAFNQGTINKLLTALNECTEWGQVFILDTVASFSPRDERESQSIIERVTPRLSHANAAVVLSAVKVIMRLLDQMEPHSDFSNNVVKKLSAPLVTLLSAEPEIQYVALRNINLIIQKRSDILSNELKVFFVKYNDPVYVKVEKLAIMIRLTNQNNIGQTLAELKEYATEVDVDFVRKSVRAIGRCAIKVDVAAERCVSTLLDLIQTKVNYVVQEAIVVIKDIFRKYPNKYESVIGTLCENLENLDEPEARASMIWIIGEYAERIDNADELLESFLDGFHDEDSQVQLQILTAVVKLFLKRPTDTQDLVQQVLNLATQESDNPDLRDRGYIYWRLLSTNPAAAKEVVLAEKPLISEQTDGIEPALLRELICHISSLASIYHKPPSTFLGSAALYQPPPLGATHDNGGEAEETLTQPSPSKPAGGGLNLVDDLLGLSLSTDSPVVTPTKSANTDLLGGGLDDLLGMSSPVPSGGSVMGGASLGGGLDDLLGFGSSPAASPVQAAAQPSTRPVVPMQTWLDTQKAKGLELKGRLVREGGQIQMEMSFQNQSMQELTNFAIQFNKNSFGLAPASPLRVQPVSPNQTVTVKLPINTQGTLQKMNPLNSLQIALKNNVDVFYFATLIPMHVLFCEDGAMEKKVYLNTWKDIPDSSEVQSTVSNNMSADELQQRLGKHNVFTVAKKTIEGHEFLYQSIKLTNGIWCLSEIKMQSGSVMISLKSRVQDIYQGIQKSYEQIITH